MSGYRTIGALRTALAAYPGECEVYIDNRRPTGLSSYRGYYSDLAIERGSVENPRTELDRRATAVDMGGYGTYHPGSTKVRIEHPATVAGLIEALGLAIGATFEGYKGGQFTMHADSDLWVSERGEVARLRVASIEHLPGRIDLRTEEDDQ